MGFEREEVPSSNVTSQCRQALFAAAIRPAKAMASVILLRLSPQKVLDM
jgi:hypothetical protein